MGFSAKVRPALAFSVPTQGDERVQVSLVPHTTSIRGTRFESPTDLRWLKNGAFDAQGIGTYPAVKLIRKLETLAVAQMGAVESCVKLWLGMINWWVPG